jgi:hypothetical protein
MWPSGVLIGTAIVCAYVCMCVCERERERDTHTHTHTHTLSPAERELVCRLLSRQDTFLMKSPLTLDTGNVSTYSVCPRDETRCYERLHITFESSRDQLQGASACSVAYDTSHVWNKALPHAEQSPLTTSMCVPLSCALFLVSRSLFCCSTALSRAALSISRSLDLPLTGGSFFFLHDPWATLNPRP